MKCECPAKKIPKFNNTQLRLFLFTQWTLTCLQSTTQSLVQCQLIWRNYIAVNYVLPVFLLLTMKRFHVVLVSFIPRSGVSIVDLEQVDARCLGCDYKNNKSLEITKYFSSSNIKASYKIWVKILIGLWRLLFETKMAFNFPINFLETLMVSPCLNHSLWWWNNWLVDLRKVTFLGIFC